MIIDQRSTAVWLPTNPGGNFTNNGYPTRIPTTSRPDQQATSTGLQAVGDGVIAMGHAGHYTALNLLLLPYGAGSATNTFVMTILGWRSTEGPNTKQRLWIPVTLGTYTATLGTGAGVAGADLVATDLFATTIVKNSGPTSVANVADWFEISPGSNAIGMFGIRSLGFRYLEVIYSTGGSATSCNALWARM